MENLVGKWPASITYIRHARSAYNALKDKRRQTDLYKEFLANFSNWKPEAGKQAPSRLLALAKEVREQFALHTGDHDTLLDEQAGCQAEEVGINLRKEMKVPDVIFVSPYHRTKETLRYVTRGWPELQEVPVFVEERIREQEHGLALLYNDWKVFTVFHPEQQELHDRMGAYWYRYPQGENVPDVRLRNWAHSSKLIRDYPGKEVLCFTHHLNILGQRSNIERWDADKFIECDDNDKPINNGVTRYVCNPEQGANGKLILEYYNKKLYE